MKKDGYRYMHRYACRGQKASEETSAERQNRKLNDKKQEQKRKEKDGKQYRKSRKMESKYRNESRKTLANTETKASTEKGEDRCKVQKREQKEAKLV